MLRRRADARGNLARFFGRHVDSRQGDVCAKPADGHDAKLGRVVLRMHLYGVDSMPCRRPASFRTRPRPLGLPKSRFRRSKSFSNVNCSVVFCPNNFVLSEKGEGGESVCVEGDGGVGEEGEGGVVRRVRREEGGT